MLTAIILAAGSSRRMGSINKLLLSYKNKPVVTHVVENILAGGIEDLVVVVGHQAAQVKNALAGLPVRFAQNEDHGLGMTGSIQKGILHANGNGYMICLSDMVLIEPAEYAFLAKNFEEKAAVDPECICQPVHNNHKGNPIIFSSSYKQVILSHEQTEGCRAIVEANREHLYPINMKTGNILQDIDYPDDYKRLDT